MTRSTIVETEGTQQQRGDHNLIVASCSVVRQQTILILGPNFSVTMTRGTRLLFLNTSSTAMYCLRASVKVHFSDLESFGSFYFLENENLILLLSFAIEWALRVAYKCQVVVSILDDAIQL